MASERLYNYKVTLPAHAGGHFFRVPLATDIDRWLTQLYPGVSVSECQIEKLEPPVVFRGGGYPDPCHPGGFSARLYIRERVAKDSDSRKLRDEIRSFFQSEPLEIDEDGDIWLAVKRPFHGRWASNDELVDFVTYLKIQEEQTQCSS